MESLLCKQLRAVPSRSPKQDQGAIKLRLSMVKHTSDRAMICMDSQLRDVAVSGVQNMVVRLHPPRASSILNMIGFEKGRIGSNRGFQDLEFHPRWLSGMRFGINLRRKFDFGKSARH